MKRLLLFDIDGTLTRTENGHLPFNDAILGKYLLVGTGRYPVEDLVYWEPDRCLADLTDTESVVAMLLEL
ncbi:MAG TPA: hypothetical protein VMR20_05210 [Verrucomicrobiae bacterium]|nr:hypothetical protein [Verrucomicrobiae bacterium]